jgi:hypothetical protein
MAGSLNTGRRQTKIGMRESKLDAVGDRTRGEIEIAERMLTETTQKAHTEKALKRPADAGQEAERKRRGMKCRSPIKKKRIRKERKIWHRLL